MIPNTNYSNLKDSYLFYNIAQKTKSYLAEHPDMLEEVEARIRAHYHLGEDAAATAEDAAPQESKKKESRKKDEDKQ